MESVKKQFLKLFRSISKEEMTILPGQLAFFLVITFIPLVALIASIAATLSISEESINLAINSSIPKYLANIINNITVKGGPNFNIIVFYISAFILASNGTNSMISVSDKIYEIKPKNIIYRRVKAIVMILMIVGIIILLVAVPVFGTTIYNIILKSTGINQISLIQKIIVLLKYPLLTIILYFIIKALYIISPDEEIPIKTTTKGALFTTISCIISTEIFAFYLEKFAKYDLFYGSISNILILLLWIYLISYIFVFGMLINASNYKKEEII